ncbi:MAG: hypothetical protein FJX52_00365, partial [Alphaproteobacteria bacterium]|nr:hypothetical protein [Alphaproteobacteria bacterium]
NALFEILRYTIIETCPTGVDVRQEEQQPTVTEDNSSVPELTRIGQSNAAASEEITATMIDLLRLAEQTRGQAESFNHKQQAA